VLCDLGRVAGAHVTSASPQTRKAGAGRAGLAGAAREGMGGLLLLAFPAQHRSSAPWPRDHRSRGKPHSGRSTGGFVSPWPLYSKLARFTVKKPNRGLIAALREDIPQSLARDPRFKSGFIKDRWHGADLLGRWTTLDSKMLVCKSRHRQLKRRREKRWKALH